MPTIPLDGQSLDKINIDPSVVKQMDAVEDEKVSKGFSEKTVFPRPLICQMHRNSKQGTG